jgi:hypothetical protein
VLQEVIVDGYPIILVHGKRIAEEVVKIVHDGDRYQQISDFLDDLGAEYPERIKQAQPEELLR